MYVFRTPTRLPDRPRLPTKPNPQTDYDDGPTGKGNLLMRHVSRPHWPVAVLVTGATVREKQAPTTDEINQATYAYLGGRDYVISEAEAAILTTAGYSVPGYDPSAFGLGHFGTGAFGQ